MIKKNKIQEFIDQIIQKAGLDKMPQDFLEEYSEKLTQEAYKAMGIAIIKELPNEKIEEFNNLVAENQEDNELINNYLKINIDDFENKMAIVLKDFVENVLKRAEDLS